MKSKDINDQVEFGLESIDPGKKIEMGLRDFMYVKKALEEFNRYFHQPLHYQNISDIKVFLGNREEGAYSVIHKLVYEILPKYLPEEIEGSKFYEPGHNSRELELRKRLKALWGEIYGY